MSGMLGEHTPITPEGPHRMARTPPPSDDDLFVTPDTRTDTLSLRDVAALVHTPGDHADAMREAVAAGDDPILDRLTYLSRLRDTANADIAALIAYTATIPRYRLRDLATATGLSTSSVHRMRTATPDSPAADTTEAGATAPATRRT